MTIQDNEIFGENYYTSGRYGYTCIDRTYANGSGTKDCLSGFTKKNAQSILYAIRECQRNSMTDLLTALSIGASGNSEELYLYATNESDLYNLWFKPTLTKLKQLLDEKSQNAYDHSNIISSLECAFEAATEKYDKELKEDKKNWTKLDVHVCIAQWLEFYKGEYKVNQLAGY